MTIITVVATHRPWSSQPATYGHLPTLVNLVDEWCETMFWGHKGNGHAGTSYKHLPEVLDMAYGHSSLSATGINV